MPLNAFSCTDIRTYQTVTIGVTRIYTIKKAPKKVAYIYRIKHGHEYNGLILINIYLDVLKIIDNIYDVFKFQINNIKINYYSNKYLYYYYSNK